MRLDRYETGDFQRGANRLTEAVWLLFSALLGSGLPGSAWRRWILICFGARIGEGVVLKPGLRIKFPWHLEVGNHTWIGERVWIDNLARVKLGHNVCISQGAYLCTGSHDWAADSFDLITKPIEVSDHAWVCAKAMLAPGTEVLSGAVITMASLGKGRLKAWTVYSGTPAAPIKPRPSYGGSTHREYAELP
ncbi:WcaF family extracellular polysaccharide biosynthesis acetyltransferase [Roseivivax jejudonensis]|uniref:WcaF family extracellular polysaccharide biosynthesis acetyltransferase n=1 Tax=Roseivivax jejudonensis TaxID=1529041 RepID=UPI000A270E33|nr:WcaF family extracellular polysaccharide biosynthesis acetyltransferase [Roseivivax jejudonensis]